MNRCLACLHASPRLCSSWVSSLASLRSDAMAPHSVLNMLTSLVASLPLWQSILGNWFKFEYQTFRTFSSIPFLLGYSMTPFQTTLKLIGHALDASTDQKLKLHIHMRKVADTAKDTRKLMLFPQAAFHFQTLQQWLQRLHHHHLRLRLPIWFLRRLQLQDHFSRKSPLETLRTLLRSPQLSAKLKVANGQ